MITYNSYTDSFRREVVGLVLSGQLSKEQARRKYGIKGHSTIMNWIRKLEGRDLIYSYMPRHEKATKQELLKRLKALERELEDEKIRSEGLSKMIDIAEEQLKITIRKKSGTKQSKR
jgi:transposase-like protein